MRATLAVLLLFVSSSLCLLQTDFEHVFNGSTPLTPALVDQIYAQFKEEYKNEVQLRRFLKDRQVDDRKKIFKDTLKEVIEHNTDVSQKWKKGINAFSDMTFEEFTQYYHIVGKDQ